VANACAVFVAQVKGGGHMFALFHQR